MKVAYVREGAGATVLALTTESSHRVIRSLILPVEARVPIFVSVETFEIEDRFKRFEDNSLSEGWGHPQKLSGGLGSGKFVWDSCHVI